MAAPGDKPKISFSFAKSKKPPLLLQKVPVKVEEKPVEYISYVDDKNLLAKKKKEELVIPMPTSLSWRDRIVNKTNSDVFAPTTKENDVNNDNEPPDKRQQEPVVIKIEDEEQSETLLTLEEQAAREILREVKLEDDTPKDTAAPLTLPIESQSLKGESESTLEDYENIPIEKFGMAMLRGMGWAEDKGIGKNDKRVSVKIPELRPRGMGLGADKLALQKKAAKSKEKGAEELKVCKGSFVKITCGKYKSSYGEVEGFDDEEGRVVVKLALGGSKVSLTEFMVEAVTQTEYSKNSKVLNVAKYEEYKTKDGGKSSDDDRNNSSKSNNTNKSKSSRDYNNDKESNSNKSRRDNNEREEEDKSRKRKSNREDNSRSGKSRRTESGSDDRSHSSSDSSESSNDRRKRNKSKKSKHKHRDTDYKYKKKKKKSKSDRRDYSESPERSTTRHKKSSRY